VLTWRSVTVSVELNYFTPFVDAVDPDALRAEGEDKESAAAAEDVAVAEGTVARMRAELRVRAPATSGASAVAASCVLREMKRTLLTAWLLLPWRRSG
jgi:hypothetical protein